jgi:hypothetical protein
MRVCRLPLLFISEGGGGDKTSSPFTTSKKFDLLSRRRHRKSVLVKLFLQKDARDSAYLLRHC